MFAILFWLIFGFIAGSIAEAIYPPGKSSSRWQTIGIGVAGSIVGGIVGSVFTGDSYQPAGFILSILGAVACMYAWRHITSGGGV